MKDRVLITAQNDALHRINRGAETLRLAVIPFPGMALVYDRKRREAVKLRQDRNPEAADYPYLAAEIGRTGQTIDQVADRVLAAVERADRYLIAIERARLDAADLVAAARTTDALSEIMANLAWPMLEAER